MHTEISFQSLKKLFLRLKLRKTSIAAEINPAHDWELILGVAAVAMVILFAAGAVFYYEIYTDKIFALPSVQNSENQLIDRTALQSTAEFYDAQQQKFNALATTSVPVVDPGSAD